jgi:hypothetical protein
VRVSHFICFAAFLNLQVALVSGQTIGTPSAFAPTISEESANDAALLVAGLDVSPREFATRQPLPV